MSSYLLFLYRRMPPNAAHHTIAGWQTVTFDAKADIAGATNF
jgi:hypothetical protein